jgi:hypothetical protein
MYEMHPDEVRDLLLNKLGSGSRFRKYVTMLKSKGSEETAGVVQKENFTFEVEASFCTSDGHFDLFLAINHIQEFSD